MWGGWSGVEGNVIYQCKAMDHGGLRSRFTPPLKSPAGPESPRRWEDGLALLNSLVIPRPCPFLLKLNCLEAQLWLGHDFAVWKTMIDTARINSHS
jgi:hypothetical protein